MKNDTLKSSLILFTITAIVGLLLGMMNFYTKDVIKQRAEQQAEESRKIVLSGLEYDSETQTDNIWVYLSSAAGDEEIVGYAIEAAGKGYGGTIRLMVGLDKDLNVLGVEILEHTETPGLGDKAQKEVSPQFIGKQSPFSVVKQNAKNSEVQAISGATITTKAVVDIVNQAIKLAGNLNQGE